MLQTVADIRKDYKLQSLNESDAEATAVAQFDKWWKEAIHSSIDEVNAMTLATVAADGSPAARIVLLKGYSENGFTFFTNYQSNKGHQLGVHPQVCLVFFWKELERQVRITGIVEKVSEAESDEYFNSRPEGSRIGAWTSPQSQVIESRHWLEEREKKMTEEFQHQPLTRPGHWGGYRVKPSSIEFWQGRPSRLHDRLLYTLLENGSWKIERLAP
ncbi:MAG: pyridoxamine 5'-phosphate oxidase [Chitinophagaceae bacterium]